MMDAALSCIERKNEVYGLTVFLIVAEFLSQVWHSRSSIYLMKKWSRGTVKAIRQHGCGNLSIRFPIVKKGRVKRNHSIYSVTGNDA